MKKTTTIHGVAYTIRILSSNRCEVIKHTKKKDLRAFTDNTEAYYYIDKPGVKYNNLDARRHIKGLFLT